MYVPIHTFEQTNLIYQVVCYYNTTFIIMKNKNKINKKTKKINFKNIYFIYLFKK